METITPEVAADILYNHNPRNRRTTQSLINRYARDMAEGRWHNTGEPIIFNQEGNLDDGQNRLYACIKAEKSFKVMVVRGVEMEAQKYMDSGKGRTAADALSLDGHDVDTRRVAIVARSILQFETLQNPTPAEIVDFAEQNLKVLAERALTAKRIQDAIGGSSGSYGAAAWYLSELDADAANEFFTALEYGTNLDDGDGRLVLRNQIVRNGGKISSPHLKRGGTGAQALRRDLTVIFKAWNAWREGRSIARLGYWRTEIFPLPV